MQPAKRPTTTRRTASRASKSSAPSLGLLLSPFAVFLAAVCLGAVHRWLGEPLGARFATEVWDLTRNLGITMFAAGPFMHYVYRANANAIAASKIPAALSPPGEAADGMEEDDHEHEHHNARSGIRRQRR